MVNPWRDLPSRSPYALDSDRAEIQRYNRFADATCHIHTELLPEPYVGSPDAPVFLLNLNPGFSDKDHELYASAAYLKAYHANLRHESQGFPFYFLDTSISYSCGFVWWTRRLRRLVRQVGDAKVVAESICCVEYFPYHSQKFGKPPRVASQDYGFELVRNALRRGAVLIVMRGEKLWLEALPELAGRYHKLESVQAPFISPRNCPGGFQKAVDGMFGYQRTSRGKFD